MLSRHISPMLTKALTDNIKTEKRQVSRDPPVCPLTTKDGAQTALMKPVLYCGCAAYMPASPSKPDSWESPPVSVMQSAFMAFLHEILLKWPFQPMKQTVNLFHHLGKKIVWVHKCYKVIYSAVKKFLVFVYLSHLKCFWSSNKL